MATKMEDRMVVIRLKASHWRMIEALAKQHCFTRRGIVVELIKRGLAAVQKQSEEERQQPW